MSAGLLPSVESDEEHVRMFIHNYSGYNLSQISLKPQWSSVPILVALISTFSLPLNAVVLLVFLRENHLMTSFTVYVMVLLSSNLIFVVFKQSVDIIHNVYQYYWWLGHTMCSFYKYFVFVFSGYILYLHVLITANRIWALTFPLGYRNWHSIKMAVCLCLVTVVYVHIVSLPGYFLDVLYYAIPLEAGCCLNLPQIYTCAVTVQMLIFNIPILFVCAAYPWLCYEYKRQRSIAVPRQPKIVTFSSSTPRGNAEVKITDVDAYKTPPADLKAVVERSFRKQRSRVSARAFAVLSCLTISIVLCWGPTQFYSSFQLIADVDNEIVDDVCFVLYSVQTLVDPIAFVFVLQDLRRSLRGMLTNWLQTVVNHKRSSKSGLSH